jgi:hypothetical protein
MSKNNCLVGVKAPSSSEGSKSCRSRERKALDTLKGSRNIRRQSIHQILEALRTFPPFLFPAWLRLLINEF